MPRFIVREVQTIVVQYRVEADNEDDARELVGAMGASEYDDIEETLDAKIISTEPDDDE